ncbi:hypothetical protein B0H34DRAFT_338272 [Crassisporium funariophilum]|nr:hypothetical protein B0H34DRAFT_338272 [Crassisporium funariophilum]
MSARCPNPHFIPFRVVVTLHYVTLCAGSQTWITNRVPTEEEHNKRSPLSTVSIVYKGVELECKTKDAPRSPFQAATWQPTENCNCTQISPPVRGVGWSRKFSIVQYRKLWRSLGGIYISITKKKDKMAKVVRRLINGD